VKPNPKITNPKTQTLKSQTLKPKPKPQAPTSKLQRPTLAGRLEIAGMSDGGAAQRSNMFKKGDVLTHVNGTDVQRMKIAQVPEP
jgi:hypothetical protein